MWRGKSSREMKNCFHRLNFPGKNPSKAGTDWTKVLLMIRAQTWFHCTYSTTTSTMKRWPSAPEREPPKKRVKFWIWILTLEATGETVDLALNHWSLDPEIFLEIWNSSSHLGQCGGVSCFQAGLAVQVRRHHITLTLQWHQVLLSTQSVLT